MTKAAKLDEASRVEDRLNWRLGELEELVTAVGCEVRTLQSATKAAQAPRDIEPTLPLEKQLQALRS